MNKFFSFLSAIMIIFALGISAHGLNYEKDVIKDSRLPCCNGGGCNNLQCTSPAGINAEYWDCDFVELTCKQCMDLHVQLELEECGHLDVTYCWLNGKKYYGLWNK